MPKLLLGCFQLCVCFKSVCKLPMLECHSHCLFLPNQNGFCLGNHLLWSCTEKWTKLSLLWPGRAFIKIEMVWQSRKSPSTCSSSWTWYENIPDLKKSTPIYLIFFVFVLYKCVFVFPVFYMWSCLFHWSEYHSIKIRHLKNL